MSQEENPLDNKDHVVAELLQRLKLIVTLGTMIIVISIIMIINPESLQSPDPIAEEVVPTDSTLVPDTLIVDGIHVASGLIAQDGYELVKNKCTRCHSGKLITQNRQTREGWKDVIVWMQETQELEDLGGSEDPILDYLAKYYAPEKKGRRRNLENIEWYDLEQ